MTSDAGMLATAAAGRGLEERPNITGVPFLACHRVGAVRGAAVFIFIFFPPPGFAPRHSPSIHSITSIFQERKRTLVAS